MYIWGTLKAFWLLATCVALARHLNLDLRNGTFFVETNDSGLFPAFVDLSKSLLRE
jgi:hypothetical protein